VLLQLQLAVKLNFVRSRHAKSRRVP